MMTDADLGPHERAVTYLEDVEGEEDPLGLYGFEGCHERRAVAYQRHVEEEQECEGIQRAPDQRPVLCSSVCPKLSIR
jgi:uncharacterized ParB-like nuclease family protein